MAKFFQPTGSSRALRAKKARDKRVAGMRLGQGPVATMGDIMLPIRTGPAPSTSTRGRVGSTGGTLIAPAGLPAGLGAVVVRGQGHGTHPYRPMLSIGHGDHALGSVLLRGQWQGGHPFTTLQSQGRGLHELVGLGDSSGMAQVLAALTPIPGCDALSPLRDIVAALPAAGTDPVPRATVQSVGGAALAYYDVVTNWTLTSLQMDSTVVANLDQMNAATQPAANDWVPYFNKWTKLMQSSADPVSWPTFTADTEQLLLDCYNALLMLYALNNNPSIWSQVEGFLGVAAAKISGTGIGTTISNFIDAVNNAVKGAGDTAALLPYFAVGAAVLAAWWLVNQEQKRGRSR